MISPRLLGALSLKIRFSSKSNLSRLSVNFFFLANIWQNEYETLVDFIELQWSPAVLAPKFHTAFAADMVDVVDIVQTY